MTRMRSSRVPRAAAFMLNKPYCGTLHAQWIVTNPSEIPKTAELQAILLRDHTVAATGPKTVIPPGKSKLLTMDWLKLATPGDFTLRVADSSNNADVFDRQGKRAVRGFRLFLTT